MGSTSSRSTCARRAASPTFDAAEATLGGPIDILVNAAGIYPCDPMLEMNEDAWDRVLDVNLKGMFLVSEECCRRLVLAHGLVGATVNITWGAAERARVGAAHYCVEGRRGHADPRVRAGIRRRNIWVNAVSPGCVEVNPLSIAYIRKRSPKPSRSAAPWTPDDIARVVGIPGLVRNRVGDWCFIARRRRSDPGPWACR